MTTFREKSERLAALSARTDPRTGRRLPEPVAPPVDPAAEGDPHPGPSDGGARQPVATPTLADRIREAEQAGDVATSMSLKTQKLAGIVRDRNAV